MSLADIAFYTCCGVIGLISGEISWREQLKAMKQ